LFLLFCFHDKNIEKGKRKIKKALSLIECHFDSDKNLNTHIVDMLFYLLIGMRGIFSAAAISSFRPTLKKMAGHCSVIF
jgi:hypothetical protein